MNSSAKVALGSAWRSTLPQLTRLAGFVALVTSAAWIVASAAMESMAASAPLACRADGEFVTSETSESH